jgi:hypothetical protein
MQLEACAEEGHGWASEAVALSQVRHALGRCCHVLLQVHGASAASGRLKHF